jgi:hypothetical protein
VANTKRQRTVYRCSICGKDRGNVRRLIAGPGGVYICNECVTLCNEIIAGEESARAPQAQRRAGDERRLLLALVIASGAMWARWSWRHPRRAVALADEATE